MDSDADVSASVTENVRELPKRDDAFVASNTIPDTNGNDRGGGGGGAVVSPEAGVRSDRRRAFRSSKTSSAASFSQRRLLSAKLKAVGGFSSLRRSMRVPPPDTPLNYAFYPPKPPSTNLVLATRVPIVPGDAIIERRDSNRRRAEEWDDLNRALSEALSWVERARSRLADLGRENAELKRALEEKHDRNEDTTGDGDSTDPLRHLVSVAASKLVQVKQEAEKFNEQHNCTTELKKIGLSANAKLQQGIDVAGSKLKEVKLEAEQLDEEHNYTTELKKIGANANAKLHQGIDVAGSKLKQVKKEAERLDEEHNYTAELKKFRTNANVKLHQLNDDLRGVLERSSKATNDVETNDNGLKRLVSAASTELQRVKDEAQKVHDENEGIQNFVSAAGSQLSRVREETEKVLGAAMTAQDTNVVVVEENEEEEPRAPSVDNLDSSRCNGATASERRVRQTTNKLDVGLKKFVSAAGSGLKRVKDEAKAMTTVPHKLTTTNGNGHSSVPRSSPPQSPNATFQKFVSSASSGLSRVKDEVKAFAKEEGGIFTSHNGGGGGGIANSPSQEGQNAARFQKFVSSASSGLSRVKDEVKALANHHHHSSSSSNGHNDKENEDAKLRRLISAASARLSSSQSHKDKAASTPTNSASARFRFDFGDSASGETTTEVDADPRTTLRSNSFGSNDLWDNKDFTTKRAPSFDALD